MSERSEQVSQAKTARVLRFRPRTSASVLAPPSSETSQAAVEDFNHRMILNAAGFACALTLTAAGIWLAFSISDLRHTQDCVLSGRRDCAPIVVIDRQSLPLRQH